MKIETWRLPISLKEQQQQQGEQELEYEQEQEEEEEEEKEDEEEEARVFVLILGFQTPIHLGSLDQLVHIQEQNRKTKRMWSNFHVAKFIQLSVQDYIFPILQVDTQCFFVLATAICLT